MAIKLVNLPKTEFGAELACDENEELRVVYRPSELDPDIYIYHDLWYPEEDYPDGFIAVPFGSVYGGKQMFFAGTKFANVEGSTGDPKPIDPVTKSSYGSWRQLMQKKIIPYNSCCAETDKIYYSATGNQVPGFCCTNGGYEAPNYTDYKKGIWMQGAHVLINETSSRKPPNGSTVFMLPLCKNHNIFSDITGKYGTGYFMKLRRDQEVMVLTGFIPSKKIQDAILKEELEMQGLQTTEKPQLSVGLEFMFMGVDLGAYYTKKPGGYRIFVAPMNVENKAELSLKDMVDQFNRLTGEKSLSEDDVKNKIKSDENYDTAASLDWNSIKFSLKMLFLDIDSQAKTTEYALSLQIIADGLIPKDITIFNVKALSFNIWNTKRQSVLDKMALSAPESF